MKGSEFIDKFRRFMKKAQLKHAWIVFIILLIAYILYSYKYYNPTIFQISTALLTILVISLTMYTSNKELRGATDRQINTFKESMDRLTNTVDKFRGFLEGEYANRRTTEALERTSAQPSLTASGSIRQGFFLADCLLKIVNNGGYITDIKLAIGSNNKQIQIGELGRNMELTNINCGRPGEIGEASNINIKIYVSDRLARRYFAQFNLNFVGNQALQIPLAEVT